MHTTQLTVPSSELEVKIVNTSDMSRVMYLREQSRPVKHVSFDISGATLAASCTDGIIYMYSLSSEQPQLIKRVDGMIGMQGRDSEASSLAVWHPDGRAFAVPTQSRGKSICALEPNSNTDTTLKNFKLSHAAISHAKRCFKPVTKQMSAQWHGLQMAPCLSAQLLIKA